MLDTSETHVYKPLTVTYINEDEVKLLETSPKRVDTALLNYQASYDLYKKQFPFIDQGLEGSPALLLGNQLTTPFGFNLGVNHVKPYFYSDEARIYLPDKPFTRLNYSQGKQELINIEINHGQQISNRLFFGVDYRRLKNQNFYYSNVVNQDRIRLNNLFNNRFYTSYFSKDRRYEVIGSYLWNRNITAETGGLRDMASFDSLSARNKLQNNEVYLTEAFGTYAQNGIKITQYFRPQQVKDTNQWKQLDPFNIQFFLTNNYTTDRIEYEDQNGDSLFYGDSLGAFKDSIHHRSLTNEFGITFKTKNITIAPSLEYSIDRVFFNGSTNTYNNINLHSLLMIQFSKVKLSGEVDLGIAGYNQGNYGINGHLDLPLFPWLNVKGNIHSSLASPFYLDNNFNSFAKQWSNSFDNSITNSLDASITARNKNGHIQVGLSAGNITNPIYYRSDSTVNQLNGNISLFQNSLIGAYHLDHVGIEVKALIQQSSNVSVLPRPEASVSTTVYSQFYLFDKNLLMQIGASGYYMSSFNAPTYIAYTRQWHVSSTATDFRSPPLLNVFLNAKVKSMKFGGSVYHLNQSFGEPNYYASPLYPRMPLVFRLNIMWDLMN